MNIPKHRVIAIDCDDVIIETSPHLVAYHNKTYGTRLGLEHMYSFSSSAWQLKDPKAIIGRIEEYLGTDEFQQITPPEETIRSIKKLAKYHELHIVTGRSRHLTSVTGAMLEQYFPGIFVSIEHTGMVGEHARSKGDICREIGADLLIDDHFQHAEQAAGAGIDVFLFGDYPWNQVKLLPKRIKRVQDWAEVERILL